MVSNENYEIWMMDYLDGNLSDTDTALLFQFLERNPHLKEELQGLGNTILSIPEEVFAAKHVLLKGSAELSDMAYPEYVAIKEVESGLNADEFQWKSSYLKRDMTRSVLFTAYAKTVLKPDDNIRYPFKNSLKRAVLMPVFSVFTFKRVTAVAAIAFLFFAGSLSLFHRIKIKDTEVAVIDAPIPFHQPKTDTPAEISAVIKERSVMVEKNSELIAVKNRSSIVLKSNKTFETIKMEPLTSKKILPLKVQPINAYELGLNAMMPIIIANNLAEKNSDRMALKARVDEQSEQLSRNAMLVTGSVKIINFLAGNETKVKKVLNKDGQMIAYQIESENITLRQRIKN